MSIRNFFAVSALFVLLLSCASCITRIEQAPAGAIATNEKYGLTGSYSATLGAGLFACNSAVNQAARDLRLTELSRINRQNVVIYQYKDVYDTRIDVTVSFIGAETSRIQIKYGKTGSRDFSKKFLQAVSDNLAARLGTAAPQL